VVAVAVTVEPVSLDKFPGNREKNREFFGFEADFPDGDANSPMILELWLEFP
jgi:hypothetical protein